MDDREKEERRLDGYMMTFGFFPVLPPSFQGTLCVCLIPFINCCLERVLYALSSSSCCRGTLVVKRPRLRPESHHPPSLLSLHHREREKYTF